MWSRIRNVMMWLLIAALPVQSWAAATMVNCGPSHHRMAPQAASGGHSSSEHHSHAHDAQVAGHDHAVDHHDMEADGHHADEDQLQASDEPQADTDQQSLSLGKFKCSACAICCLGMALPSSVLSFDASVSSETVQPGMPHGHVVFLTAGPERPPRTILA
jgi:hypothetical protein